PPGPARPPCCASCWGWSGRTAARWRGLRESGSPPCSRRTGCWSTSPLRAISGLCWAGFMTPPRPGPCWTG
ncbi:Toxin-antitoxin system, antitoxin component, ribbon-helix-helix domain protein, partial [Dysosmobacter welbionis]